MRIKNLMQEVLVGLRNWITASMTSICLLIAIYSYDPFGVYTEGMFHLTLNGLVYVISLHFRKLLDESKQYILVWFSFCIIFAFTSEL